MANERDAMMQILIALEKTEPTQASWLIFNEQGTLQQSVISTSLSEFKINEKNNKVTVIVPAEDVLLTSVDLPKLNHQQLLQALPFALEELLVEDISQLHFAIAHRENNGSFPVAVISKQKMTEWLTLFHSLNIHPVKITPAIFALPTTENSWDIVITKNICLVRTGNYQGFACDKDNVTTLLELNLDSSSKKPKVIHLFCTSADNTLSIHFDEIEVKISTLTETELLTHMQEWITTYPTINLLQGAYQVKLKPDKTKKIWLLASVLAIAWISCAFINQLASFFILHHQAQHLEAEINTIYRQHFPHASSIIAPRERMMSKLNQLNSQSNKNYFLTLLAETGKALSHTPSMRLNRLDYRENQLNLALSVPAFDNLDAIISTLSKQDLIVKQQNAVATNGKVNATVLVKRGNR